MNDALASLTPLVLALLGTLPLCAATNYVSLTGTHQPPFTNWYCAATNIQDAVDAASAGDLVLVMSGVYAAGGTRTPEHTLSNRVAITRTITLQSVFGARSTAIVGSADPSTDSDPPGFGPGALRCLYLTNGAAAVGFTLSHGYTSDAGDMSCDRSGGGAFLDRGGMLLDCTVISNMASRQGGGVCLYYGGCVSNSVLADNQSAYTPDYLPCFGEGGGAFSISGILCRTLIQRNTSVDDTGTTGHFY